MGGWLRRARVERMIPILEDRVRERRELLEQIPSEGKGLGIKAEWSVAAVPDLEPGWMRREPHRFVALGQEEAALEGMVEAWLDGRSAPGALAEPAQWWVVQWRKRTDSIHYARRCYNGFAAEYNNRLFLRRGPRSPALLRPFPYYQLETRFEREARRFRYEFRWGRSTPERCPLCFPRTIG